MSRSSGSGKPQPSSTSQSNWHLLQQQQRQRQSQNTAASAGQSTYDASNLNIHGVHQGQIDDMSVLSAQNDFGGGFRMDGVDSSAHPDFGSAMMMQDDLPRDFSLTIEDVDRNTASYAAGPYGNVPYESRSSPSPTGTPRYSLDQSFGGLQQSSHVMQSHAGNFDQWTGLSSVDPSYASSEFRMSPSEPFPALQGSDSFGIGSNMTVEPGSYGLLSDLQFDDSPSMEQATLSRGTEQSSRRRSTSRKRKQFRADQFMLEGDFDDPSPRMLSRGSTWNHSISPSMEPAIRPLQRHSTLGPYGPVDNVPITQRRISGSDFFRPTSAADFEASSSGAAHNAMSLEYLSSPETPSIGASAYEDDGSQANDFTSPLQAPTSGHPQDLKNHLMLITPAAQPYILERVCDEQLKRYQRLSDWKMKHEEAVSAGSCSSDAQCHLLGHPIILNPISKASGPRVTFLIDTADVSDTKLTASRDHRYEKATFPEGIPNPPVKSLPAKFECTLCFKVKQFDKPSDWTKHVHEDVQPFTCTFPCPDAKSFKRKADWLRHENERHRQLEKWVCSIDDCAHTCHRKDNFIQHLVREHRLPEPRNRAVTGRNDITDPVISKLVHDCRVDTTDQALNEPCRFCHETFPDWKKLTAHVSKHMEQISLPLIELINQLGPGSSNAPAPQPALPRARTWNTSSSRQSSLDHSDMQPISRTQSFGNDQSSSRHARRVSRDSIGASRHNSSGGYQPSLLAPPDASSLSLSQPDSPMSDSMTPIFSPIIQSPDAVSGNPHAAFAWPSSSAAYTTSPIDVRSTAWDTASTSRSMHADNDVTMAGTQFSYDPSYDHGAPTSLPARVAQQEHSRPSSGSRSSSDNAQGSSRNSKGPQSRLSGGRERGSSSGQKKRHGKG